MPTRPPRAFTSGLPLHRVTPMTAGYDYGVTREPTPAGLSPASSSVSFAALPPLATAGGRSPASSVLSRRYDFLPPIPPHFVSFVWRYLGCTRCFRSPADECAAEAWSWSPGISGRDVAEETTGSRKFLGNPTCPFAHAPIRRRQDCLHQTIKCSSVALGHRKAKAPTIVSFDAQ